MSQPPEDKKPDFSNFPRGAIGIKGLPVGRNARLPSIRSPRDLTLGSQPKRTFTPNIPVRREKKSSDVKLVGESSSGSSSNRNTPKSTPQRAERGRGRGRGKAQLIQLEGSVFGEGIAPSQLKATSSRHRESASKSEFSSGRPYVKKEKTEYDVQRMEREMKNLLRDDFIDDGDDSSGDESMKPTIFPVKEVKLKQEKTEKVENPEKDEKPENFPSQDFAKTMGFDVEKIAKFIKKEKTDVPNPLQQPDWSKVPKNEISEVLTSRDSPLFLLQIPHVIHTPSNVVEKPDSTEEKKNVTSLTSMPDGPIGKLQILKSGRARINIGSLNFYIDDFVIDDTSHGKRELVSIDINSGSGDVACLGHCEKTLVLEPEIDLLMPESKSKKS